jgi:hypothetical protein
LGKKCCRRETFALIRLHLLAEGQTEEGLTNSILAPEFGVQNIFVDTHRVTTGRRHGRNFRGGLVSYEHLARDLTLWMKQDQNEDSWFTTLIDFYGLPDNFPGYEMAKKSRSAIDAVAVLEDEFGKDIVKRLGGIAVSRRFIPYIQLHEFEALLFSNPSAFSVAFPADPKAVGQLAAIRTQFSSPEDINDGQMTAPSRRIIHLFPDYQKPVSGLLIAKEIGLATIRGECRRFDNWLARIVELGA